MTCYDCSKKNQNFFWSLSKRLGFEVFPGLEVKGKGFFEVKENLSASTSVPRNCLLVAVSPPWSGKSRRIHLCLEIGADPALVWKVSPSPPWFAKPRRFHIGRTVSALVTPSPPYLRRLRLGRAASGFRPKLHSRAEIFSLECLSIYSGKSRHESLQGSRRARIQINCIVAPRVWVWKVWT